ncbi:MULTISPECIES: cation:proton antiporter [unclassified Burkholderia]|uniref:cation:proton antiporter n=1 Tax=unclassified Burkholderia TaxID=2613784 RepID=UPI000759C63E|nr:MULTISPECIES: cation:proton antiporter [unclassified Burkholderia]KVN14480.1 sodium:proton exchanger [Burkholderia sp. MSMB1552]KWZ55985.1 sodium:proton exchanger [Burkholderia sp. MSMB1588]
MADWILQLCVVIVVAFVLGALAQRLGQGRVVGELLAGLLLGPSAFGALAAAGHGVLPGEESAAILSRLGELGLVFLMFQTGTHIAWTIPQRRSAALVATVVAACGMALPFATGSVIAIASSHAFQPQASPLAYVLFCGIALSVSALPVMMRIVADARIAHRPAATLSILAATLTDALGWLILAAVGAIATSGLSPASTLHALGVLVAFFVASITLVRKIVLWLLDRARRDRSGSATLICALGYLLLSSWAASRLGFHSAFGALVAAVALSGRDDLRQWWDARFAGLADLVLIPLFFVSMGFRASFSALDGGAAWGWLVAFLIGGVAAKFGGCYAGARLCGIDRTEATLIGVLMNCRGTVELMVLAIGLQLRIIPVSLYTVLLIATLTMTWLSAMSTHRLAKRQPPRARRMPAADAPPARRAAPMRALGDDARLPNLPDLPEASRPSR